MPWEIIQNYDNPDEMIEVWNMLFLEAISKHTPLKCHRAKMNCQPDWVTPEILDNIKERNKGKVNGV